MKPGVVEKEKQFDRYNNSFFFNFHSLRPHFLLHPLPSSFPSSPRLLHPSVLAAGRVAFFLPWPLHSFLTYPSPNAREE